MAAADGPRSRAGKHHSTASAWTVKQKSSKRYRLEEHELFKLGDGAQVYADVYKVDGDQPEEHQEKDTFTHGFKPLISSVAFEHDRLPLHQFRAKRFDLRRKINDLRSRSRKKKYADNPIPVLVQVSAEERAAFIARLADLQVPLGDLAQTIPFGFKADVLLDTIVTRRVAPQRATWLIKVVYLNLYSDKNKARGGVRRPALERKLKCKDEYSEQLHQYITRAVQTDLQLPDGAARRSYLLALVTWQYRAGLVSRVKTLYWIIGQLDECSTQDAALLVAAFYLPLICRFIDDVQLSRMHSYRLFTACCALVKKTQVGRAIHHESKTNICNVSEAILLYLNDAIPLSLSWRGALASMSFSASPAVIETSMSFNLPRFLLDLDCVRECVSTSAIVGRVVSVMQKHDQTAVNALLQWSISLHRAYHTCRALIASFLLALLRAVNESVLDMVVTFVSHFVPPSAEEADQAVIVLSELSRSGLFNTAKAIRMMVAQGLIGNAADARSPQYMFCRYVLEWVPLPDRAPSYVAAQRSLYLYGPRSTYDDLLHKRLMATVCRHLDGRSLGLFLPALFVTDPEAHRISSDPINALFTDDLNTSWKHFVNTDNPALTDLRSIMRIAPLYHLIPILNSCIAAFLRLGRTTATESRMLTVLALEDSFYTLVTALQATRQHSLLCPFLISALDDLPVLQHSVVNCIRASFPLFQCLSLENALRNACALLMRRDLQAVQQAEIWIANARFPSPLTRWLSENVVQKFFSGRYHGATTMPQTMAPASTERIQQDLLTLIKSIGPETQFDQVDALLSMIAVDNQSIGTIVSFILDQVLVHCDTRSMFIPRAMHLLYRVSLVSDRLGDNRVPCHDIILTRYISKVTELLPDPVQRALFVELIVDIVNSGLLQLDIVIERVIVRPLRTASSSKSNNPGAAVACLLSSTLLGGTLGASHVNAHFLMHCHLISESVSIFFPVVTLLSELGLHSDIPELSDLARMSLNSLLVSKLFVQFCLTSLQEVYAQIVHLPSARWLLRCLCSNHSTSLPAYDPEDSPEESIPLLLSSLSPWTVHIQWIDVQLAVQAQNRRCPTANAEQRLAEYLLLKPEHTDDVISADISVELIKLLPSLIGKHILNSVHASLLSENKEFLESICNIDVMTSVTLMSTAQSASHRNRWRIPSETAVHALAVSLPAGDCVSFVSSLSEQFTEIVQNLTLYSDNPHLQPLVLNHIMTRVRCLQYVTGVALQRAGECHFHDLVRSLLMLLLSEVFLQADETDFDTALSLFERLIDDLRFGDNAPADGSASQRKDDDFIINLDRECNSIQIPFKIRRKVQRTLPTFSGAIIDYRPITSTPNASIHPIAPVTTPSAMSPTNLFAMPSATATSTSSPLTSIACVQDDLYAVDPWTILQGVPGIPLVQKLLEHSCIVTRDGSSIDPDS